MNKNLRRFPFKNVLNMRDLGGYPTKNQKLTKFNKFIRSSLPNDLLNEEINFLLNKNIRDIIDLRQKSEISYTPCMLSEIKSFNYQNIPLYAGDKVPSSEEEISKSYFTMTNDKESMKKIFLKFINSENNILFHCSLGKDRTGVVSALLLSLAEVYYEDILVDYQITNTYMQKKNNELRNKYPDLPGFAGKSNPEYLDNFFKFFYNEYKSTENYLLTIGISKLQITSLRRKIIE